jgi:hypothetical protein
MLFYLPTLMADLHLVRGAGNEGCLSAERPFFVAANRRIYALCPIKKGAIEMTPS